MDYLISHIEGNWSRHGPTQWGINAKANPDLAQLIRAKRLTREQAVERYRSKYWTQVPRRDGLPLPVAFFLFDRVVQGAPGYFVDKVVVLKILASGVHATRVPELKRQLVNLNRYGYPVLDDRTGSFLTRYPTVAMQTLIDWVDGEKAARKLHERIKTEPASLQSMQARLSKVAIAMRKLWQPQVSRPASR